MHAHFLFFTHNMNALTWDIIIISIPSFPLASFTAFSWFASLHKVLQVGQCLCTRLSGAEWSRVEQVQRTKTSYQKYLQSNIPNYIEIPVRRDRLMEDSFFHIMRVKNVEHLKARVMIKFQGEEGLDFGGLSR